MTKFFQIFFAIIAISLLSGCASYKFGKGKRVLPGGYDRLSVPMFANKTEEVGIETYFTQDLRTEFERSRLARIVPTNDAQMVLEGTIKKLVLVPGVPVSGPGATTSITSNQISTPNPIVVNGIRQQNPLPVTAILNKQYTVIIDVHIDARRASDHSVIWASDFQSQRPYDAPLLGTAMLPDGTPGINTAAPLYNEASRQDTVSRIAKDMMQEAHDRLTENF